MYNHRLLVYEGFLTISCRKDWFEFATKQLLTNYSADGTRSFNRHCRVNIRALAVFISSTPKRHLSYFAKEDSVCLVMVRMVIPSGFNTLKHLHAHSQVTLSFTLIWRVRGKTTFDSSLGFLSFCLCDLARIFLHIWSVWSGLWTMAY